tara:strand:+ start:15030 stop:15218 length:189 start_codon:yes stop_codon:yes gene_type:complete
MAEVILTEQDVFTGDAPISKLVDDLEELFPPVNPLPTHDIATIMFRSGQRAVVDYLKDKYDV